MTSPVSYPAKSPQIQDSRGFLVINDTNCQDLERDE